MPLLSNRKLLWLSLFILSAGLNLALRVHAISLSYLGSAAKERVYERIRSGLEAQVASSEYAQLPEGARKGLLRNLLHEYLKENLPAVRRDVAALTAEFKDYLSDESGRPYLSETDPYRWMRRVESYLSTGRFGVLRQDGSEYDALESAPAGDKIEPIKLHFYLGAFFSRILQWFDRDLSLMNSLALVPVILSPLLVLAVFLACGSAGLHPAHAFLASLFLGLSPAAMIRTGYGWFDTDIYNISMPLFMFSALSGALRYQGLPRLALVSLGGILVGIHSGLWSIWWLFFYLLLIALFADYLFTLKSGKGGAGITLKEIMLLITLSFLSVLLISGRGSLVNAIREPFSYLGVRQSLALGGIWPDVVGTVAELERPDFADFGFAIGGTPLFIGLIVAVFFLLFNYREFFGSAEKRFLFLAAFCWAIPLAAMTYFGRRFINLLIAPSAVIFCMTLELLYRRYLAVNVKYLKLHRYLAGVVFCGAAALFVSNAYISRQVIFMNDSWWKMCKLIRESTEPDAIINADWPEGDWIISLGRRAAIQDAHWQYTPVPYWFSRALISTNEKESMGILRMLDAGGASGFQRVVRAMNCDPVAALKFIDRLLVADKAEGRAIIDSAIKDHAAAEGIYRSFFEPKSPGYILISHYLMNVMEELSRTGSWDFQRLDYWQRFQNYRKKNFLAYALAQSGSAEAAEKLYRTLVFMDRDEARRWLSRASYKFYMPYSRLESRLSDNPKWLIFNDALSIDMTTLKATYFDRDSGRLIIPGSIIFSEGESFHRYTDKAGDPDYAVFLRKESGFFKAAVFTASLEETLFFKLYFLKGGGLKHFKFAHQELKPGYTNVYLYKISWD